MAVPKKKVSKSRRNMRRSHDRLNLHEGNICKNCNKNKQNYQVCVHCGFYKGKFIKQKKNKIFSILSKKNKIENSLDKNLN